MQRHNDRFVERLPLATVRPWAAYVISVLLCVIALVARLAAQPVLPTGYPYVTFFPAVIISSFLFGVRPGVFAAIICWFFSWHFFIETRGAHLLSAATISALLFYAFVVGTDIALVHWMQRANYKLAVERERNRTLAENRELLFRELQHRVSNNLQVVAALLSLQRRDVDDEEAAKALDQASQRLAVIGKISRNLYDPEGQWANFADFLSTLVADIIDANARHDLRIDLDVDEHMKVEPQKAVPLAIIVTELLSNAIEHGFPDGAAGSIRLTAGLRDGKTILELRDDGRGLPPGFSMKSSSSLGLRIASALAMQSGGSFTLEPGEAAGAVARLEIVA